MEAIIHKCQWCLDGLLMGEEQLQEAIHISGPVSKQIVSILVCGPSGVKPGHVWPESSIAVVFEARSMPDTSDI